MVEKKLNWFYIKEYICLFFFCLTKKFNLKIIWKFFISFNKNEKKKKTKEGEKEVKDEDWTKNEG